MPVFDAVHHGCEWLDGSQDVFELLALVTAYLALVGGTYRVHFVLGLFVVFAVNTVLLVVESQKSRTSRTELKISHFHGERNSQNFDAACVL